MSRATIEVLLPQATTAIEVGLTTPAAPDVSARVAALENPAVVAPVVDYQATTAAYIIVMRATGKTVTLPLCDSSLIGREWSVTLGVLGSVTIQTSAGNSFPTPTNAAETVAIINTRGSTVRFRCVSPTEWVMT